MGMINYDTDGGLPTFGVADIVLAYTNNSAYKVENAVGKVVRFL